MIPLPTGAGLNAGAEVGAVAKSVGGWVIGALVVMVAIGGLLVVDCAQLDYISSAGFRVLLQAAKRAEQNTAKFVLCGVSGKVRQLFDLGGFLDLFTISASRDEAISGIR